MTRRFAAAVLAVALIGACSGGSKPPPPIPGNTTRPGMGDSNDAPSGTAYSPPPGVSFGLITAETWGICASAPTYGTGSLVDLCVPIVASSATTVTLPAGLVVVSTSLEKQNGILLQPVTISVGAGTTHVVVKTYCINIGRGIPWGESHVYTIGPITDDPAMKELISLVAGKYLADSWAQYWVWDITDFDGLTAEDRADIAALPSL
jgi:hypothetical protein